MMMIKHKFLWKNHAKILQHNKNRIMEALLLIMDYFRRTKIKYLIFCYVFHSVFKSYLCFAELFGCYKETTTINQC